MGWRFVPDLPETLRNHRRFVATLRDVTWVVAFYEIGSSVWDIWLYNNSGVTSFVIIRLLGNYLASFVLIFATLIYVERRFSTIEGCPSLVELVSRHQPRPHGRLVKSGRARSRPERSGSLVDPQKCSSR